MTLTPINMEEETWEGQVTSSTLRGIDPDDAWSLLGDFCGLHKFYPTLATSHKVEGADGEPGCVRYCATPLDEAGGVMWAKERLLEMDAVERRYSYDVVENNMGIGKYAATLKVIPVGGDGCGIEWSFEAGAIDGWTRSGFLCLMEGVVEEMARRVGDALRAN